MILKLTQIKWNIRKTYFWCSIASRSNNPSSLELFSWNWNSFLLSLESSLSNSNPGFTSSSKSPNYSPSSFFFFLSIDVDFLEEGDIPCNDVLRTRQTVFHLFLLPCLCQETILSLNNFLVLALGAQQVSPSCSAVPLACRYVSLSVLQRAL